MASVLRINPERIRVTNIVPGNRRRMQEPASCTATDAQADQSVCDAALASDPGGTDCTNAGCAYVAPSLSADGLDIGFDISAVDPCATVNCGGRAAFRNLGILRGRYYLRASGFRCLQTIFFVRKHFHNVL